MTTLIFGGSHIGIQHHCQATPPSSPPTKQNAQQFHQQTSPSHSDPCTVYLLHIYLISMVNVAIYIYTIIIHNIHTYINPIWEWDSPTSISPFVKHFAHIFFGPWLSVVWPAALRGPGRHFFRGGGRFFSHLRIRGGRATVPEIWRFASWFGGRFG